MYWDFQQAFDPNNIASVNLTTFIFILDEFIREHDDSVTWFPAAGGVTFILAATLRYVRQTPRDRWEWINLYSIGGAGIICVLLSVLDIGSGKPVINPAVATNPSLAFVGSPIFKVERAGWILPSYAVLNALVLIALGVENYFARRSTKRRLESHPGYTYEEVNVNMLDTIGVGQVAHWVERTQHRFDPYSPPTRSTSYDPWVVDPFQVLEGPIHKRYM